MDRFLALQAVPKKALGRWMNSASPANAPVIFRAVPKKALGRWMKRAEEDKLLGYGPEGV